MWWWAVALAESPRSVSVEHPTWGFGAAAGPWIVVKTPNETATTDFDAALVGHLGVALRPPVWVEVEAPLGLTEGGLRWAPRVQLAILSPGARLRPSIVAGVSGQGATSSDPTAAAPTRVVPHWGAGLAVKAGGPWFRVDARHTIDVAVDPANPQHHVTATLGLEWLPVRKVEPVAVVPPPPVPPPAPPTFQVQPAVEVWISHPVCAWVPSSEAPALIAGAPAPVTVVAAGYLPIVVDPASTADIVLREAPAGGAVVVAAAPGDHVFVDEVQVPVSAAGQAILNTVSPLVAVRVEGGGRRVETELAPINGWGVWYRASAPPVLEIRFPQGSAAPPPEASVQVGQLVSLSGDRRYRLQGSYSAEGAVAANQQLASARAEAVRKLMVDAGFDPTRIEVLPVSSLGTDDPAAARVVIVSSTGPEAP